jgi:uncharacterized membrane protein YgcG
MRTIRSISVASAFEYGAFIAGLLYFAQAVIALVIFALYTGKEGQLTGWVNEVLYAGANLVGLIIVVVVATLVGGLATAFTAALYNLAARFTGGIRIELS